MTESDTQTSKTSLAGKKIMWIEDDKFLSDIISRKLSHEQCILIHATEGESAISMVEAEMPDVILLDIGLPDINGYEIARQLRARKTSALLVALSGFGQVRDKDEAREAGFDHHFTKPVEFSKLEEVLTLVGSI